MLTGERQQAVIAYQSVSVPLENAARAAAGIFSIERQWVDASAALAHDACDHACGDLRLDAARGKFAPDQVDRLLVVRGCHCGGFWLAVTL